MSRSDKLAIGLFFGTLALLFGLITTAPPERERFITCTDLDGTVVRKIPYSGWSSLEHGTVRTAKSVWVIPFGVGCQYD